MYIYICIYNVKDNKIILVFRRLDLSKDITIIFIRSLMNT